MVYHWIRSFKQKFKPILLNVFQKNRKEKEHSLTHCTRPGYLERKNKGNHKKTIDNIYYKYKPNNPQQNTGKLNVKAFERIMWKTAGFFLGMWGEVGSTYENQYNVIYHINRTMEKLYNHLNKWFIYLEYNTPLVPKKKNQQTYREISSTQRSISEKPMLTSCLVLRKWNL